ncbi:MAG: GH92 family glycosyl hydrolase [Clostridia bacterium]|nr:GH92 family glycosyl hydrolase [Clostridia bacterium]
MYLSYVNVKMGTKSTMRYSCGNTLPLTQLPFAMASFCPQTERIQGQENWFYKPDMPYLEGIRLTHQPSPWIGDYGTFLFTPQNDIVANTPSSAYSGMRLEDTVLMPHYIRARFLRSDGVMELTPTKRGGAIRLSFFGNRQNYLTVFGMKGENSFSCDTENSIVYAQTNGHSQDINVGFTMYMALRFEKGTVDLDNTYCERDCIHIALKGDRAECGIGISYISPQMALNNIEQKPFDVLLKDGEDIWEKTLGRIEIDADEEMKRTFYSCMYRSFLFPHMAYEIDENGKKVHHSFSEGCVREGVKYTDSGFWDTARTQFPLFSLIAREEYEELLQGFVNDYKESGWLPRWHSYGEVGCMPSTLIDGIIAEASVQGISSEELLNEALEGMLHHASCKSEDRRYGREGVLEYLSLGYVPCDKYKESVNLTLDASYGDWCIAQVATRLGREDIAKEYMARSKSYKTLFDKETGFMRGKMSNGEFREGFDPTVWGVDYTEGSAWQNSFFVPHDIEGLCQLYGGKEGLSRKLDELFATPPAYRVHGYGGEIHEMTEMAQVDFGQCAISNQPSFHIPYLYACIGEGEKTEYWVGRMCRELFKPTADGYPGDEDNGSMSAWYILSILGMYPICPGNGELIKIKPLVKSAKILGKKII